MGPIQFLKLFLKKLFSYVWRNLMFRRRIYRLFMFATDWVKGVDFERIESLDKLGLNKLSSEQYEATKLFELNGVLNSINIPKNCTAIDFGAGKGKVVNFLSKNPKIEKVSGIEISKRLVRIANNNLKKLGSVNTKMYCVDARKTPIFLIDEAQLFYFYNPFPREVFDEVFRLIENSLITNKPRKAILIYFNPVFDDIVSKSKVFYKRTKYKNKISQASFMVYFTKEF